MNKSLWVNKIKDLLFFLILNIISSENIFQNDRVLDIKYFII